MKGNRLTMSKRLGNFAANRNKSSFICCRYHQATSHVPPETLFCFFTSLLNCLSTIHSIRAAQQVPFISFDTTKVPQHILRCLGQRPLLFLPCYPSPLRSLGCPSLSSTPTKLSKPKAQLGTSENLQIKQVTASRKGQQGNLDQKDKATMTSASTSDAPSGAAAPPAAPSYSTDPALYIYTSLTAGSSHIVTATSRLETILRANRVPFKAIDLATDEKARMLWGRRAGKDESGRLRKLPGLVQMGLVLGVSLHPPHSQHVFREVGVLTSCLPA